MIYINFEKLDMKVRHLPAHFNLLRCAAPTSLSQTFNCKAADPIKSSAKIFKINSPHFPCPIPTTSDVPTH